MFGFPNIPFMGASLLITLREGLEISLVLAILLGYLVKTGRHDRIGAMWTGAAAATVLCVIAGIAVHAATDGLEGKAEQAVEGVMALAACAVLTWMILWMRANARTLGGQLRGRLDAATTASAVGVVAFVAVAREGFETALFLLSAETAGASASEVVVGGLVGLAISAVVGVLVYRWGSRIDLRRFFTVTGVLLILFAAGLAGKAVHEFRELLGFEGGLLFSPLWELTTGPFASGTLYDFLKGLFGWSASPERIRVVTYLGYAVAVTWAFLRPERTATTVATDSTDTVSSPTMVG